MNKQVYFLVDSFKIILKRLDLNFIYELKMKYFILFFFFYYSNLISQEFDYKNYYKLCYEAEYHVALNKKQEAWDLYNQAFVEFFPQIGNLNKAIELGEYLQNNGENVETQLDLLIELKKYFFTDNFLIRSEINGKIKKVFLEYFPYLTESDFKPLTINKINNLLELSKFLYADQTIRKIENSTCKDSLIIKVDKKIYTDFSTYIRVNGYPNKKEYGMYAIYPYFLLMHNSIYYGITSEIEKLLLQQIEEGNFHPSMYARLVDRYRSWVTLQPQLYGEWIENGKIGKIEDIKNLDKRRAAIGLEPYYEFCFKNNYTLPKDYIIPKKYMK